VGSGTDGGAERPAEIPEQSLTAYGRELHISMIVVLTVFLALLLFAGWKLKPVSTALHISVNPIQLSVAADPGGSLGNLVETMTPWSGTGTQLELADNNAKGPWKVTLASADGSSLASHPAWNVCTPHTSGYALDGDLYARSPYFPHSNTNGAWEIDGNGPLLVQVCWPHVGPESISGAYLSADFPVVNLPAAYLTAMNDPSQPDAPFFMAELTFSQPDTAYGYTIQSASQPTSTFQYGLVWQNSTTEQGFHVTASDTNALSQESFHTFLSGLALGIAGAVFIVIVQEFLGPVIRRDDKRNEKRFLN